MGTLGGTPVLSPTNGVYVIPGRLLGGAGVVTRKAGKGFSVSYVSAGRYRVTFDVNYSTFVGAIGDLFQSAGNYYTVKVVAFAPGTGGAGYSVDFLVAAAGTPTDLNAGEEVHFLASFARTVTP